MSAIDVKSPAGLNCFFMSFKNVNALEDNEEKNIFGGHFGFLAAIFFFGRGQDNFSKNKK